MDTAEILRKCRALPSVTVKTTEHFAELLLSNNDGSGKMRFIPMFPGIMLAVITVNAPSWPAPVPSRPTPDAKGPLIINYCIRGRCELVLNNNKSVFLTSGQISLTEKFAQDNYIYPGNIYEGFEIFIDPETAANGVTVLSECFGLDITKLKESYCPNGETYISSIPLPDALLKKLFVFSEAQSTMNLVGMKTGMIDLFARLLSDRPESSAQKLVFYTRSQVEIAKRIEAVITEDLSLQHTVREFSEQFSVSESSIKNYFHGVFGQSISQYTTHKRMTYASKLLSETDLPIIEISGRVGYENQSKFAAAFRREYGVTPLEYRRKQKISAAK